VRLRLVACAAGGGVAIRIRPPAFCARAQPNCLGNALVAAEGPEEVWRNWFLRAYWSLPELAEDKAG
jgi:hypothetical protein